MAVTPSTSCIIDAVNGSTTSGYTGYSVNSFLTADVTLFLQITTLSVARSVDDMSVSMLDTEQILAITSLHSWTNVEYCGH